MKAIAVVVVVALGLGLAGWVVVGGEEEAKVEGNRRFTAEDVRVRGDGRILLAGIARRGRQYSKKHGYSEEYDECRGEGNATRDFAVVHLSSTGRIEGDYSVTERDLEACAEYVTETSLDAEGGLRVLGTVRVPPGLMERILGPGSGTPEDRERTRAFRFVPEGPLDEDAGEGWDYPPTGSFYYADLRLPNGDWLLIEEDFSRERRWQGVYYPTISLARWRGDGPRLWSFPVRAIPPKADLESLELDEGEGWALFADARRGFYGLGHYILVSGEEQVVLFRHRLDGRPDPEFGDRGRVLVAPDARWSYGAMAVRAPDGDFVVVGEVVGDGGPVIVRRYTAGGRRVDRGAPSVECGALVGLDVQNDGKLVLACQLDRRRGTAVIRLLPNGRIDRAFGRNGRVVVPKI